MTDKRTRKKLLKEDPVWEFMAIELANALKNLERYTEVSDRSIQWIDNALQALEKFRMLQRHE